MYLEFFFDELEKIHYSEYETFQVAFFYSEDQLKIFLNTGVTRKFISPENAGSISKCIQKVHF